MGKGLGMKNGRAARPPLFLTLRREEVPERVGAGGAEVARQDTGGLHALRELGVRAIE